MKPLLELKQVSRMYQMGDTEVYALRDINLKIYQGEFALVFGPSGSGKSTLLNILGGMDRPTSGDVIFKDKSILHYTDQQITMYRRKQIGFVFQFYNLLPTLTALENVQVAVEVADDPLDPKEVLAMVGLGDRMEHFPSQMSGGQQQRVAIARALASNPAMLLCDEPTGALDSQTSKEILALLADVNQRLKKTLIIITHDPALRLISDRTLVIRDGMLDDIEIHDKRESINDVDW